MPSLTGEAHNPALAIPGVIRPMAMARQIKEPPALTPPFVPALLGKKAIRQASSRTQGSKAHWKRFSQTFLRPWLVPFAPWCPEYHRIDLSRSISPATDATYRPWVMAVIFLSMVSSTFDKMILPELSFLNPPPLANRCTAESPTPMAKIRIFSLANFSTTWVSAASSPAVSSPSVIKIMAFSRSG